MSPIVCDAVCLLFAQQAVPVAQPEGWQVVVYGYLLPFGMVGLVFYLMFLKPQSKMRQEQEQLLSAIKKNDRVVLECGIVGVVVGQSSDGKEIVLRTHEDTRLTVLRTAVRGRYGSVDASEPAAKS